MIVLICAVFTTLTSLYISKTSCKVKLTDFVKNIFVFLFNLLPIFLLSLIFSTKSLNGSLIVLLAVNTASLIHYYKVKYREEPLYLKDVFIIKEAADMSGKYPLSFKNSHFAVYLISILVLITAQIGYAGVEIKLVERIILIILFILYVILTLNEKIYKNIRLKKLSPYVEIENYQSRGFIYPLINSLKDFSEYKYKKYDKKSAKDSLEKYTEEKIEDINFVVVMLESFKDFSKVKGNFKFKKDPYEYFHKLQSEGISGGLLVDVFGGGTFTTEMEVLTGFKNLPKFKKETSTHVSYFKEMGYRTTAHHPYKGHFYKRDEVYKNIGFDEFKNYDNCFSKISKTPLEDREFFKYLMEDFKENIKTKNVFSFSVTYQNHGPYSTKKEGEDILFDRGYDQELFNYFNNYLRGVSKTSKALKILTENLNEISKKTVLLIFGDHSPTMGEDKKLIDMFEIDENLETLDGARNLYETPYVIWANESLKKSLKLSGEKRLIEPVFLMSELFSALGIKGSKYNQFLGDCSEKKTLLKEYLNEEMDEEYKNVEYFVQRRNL